MAQYLLFLYNWHCCLIVCGSRMTCKDSLWFESDTCTKGVFSFAGVFETDTGSQRVKYPNPITPSAWAFIIIWPLIFLWNGAGALYQVVTLCMARDKSPILRGPPLIPVVSCSVFMIVSVTPLSDWSLLWTVDVFNFLKPIITKFSFD